MQKMIDSCILFIVIVFRFVEDNDTGRCITVLDVNTVVKNITAEKQINKEETNYAKEIHPRRKGPHHRTCC